MLIDFRQLWPKYNIKPSAILHIGGNRGEEAPVYLELGVTHQYWIEANPDIYERLKVNLSGNPDAFAFNYCIGDKDFEDVIFHVSNNDSQSSSVLELGTHLLEHPDVNYVNHIPMKTRTIDSLLTNGEMRFPVRPDFLNCDLQGFDLNAIKGMGGLIQMFKWAYIEVNTTEMYKKCALLPEVEEYMNICGFRLVETRFPRNKTWGDALFVR